MLETFADVPAYPLVFPVFWGAAAFFVLAMARHLRVFAAVRATGPSPFSDIPARFTGLIQYAFVQTKMFKDPRAGIMHAGIFWGFVLLTIGTANIVTGGIIQAVISIPFDGILWTAVSAMQNVVAVIVLASIGWAFCPAPGHEAGAAHVQPRRAGHPVDDRRRRRHRAPRPGGRVRPLRRPAWGLRRGRPRRPAAGAAARRARGAVRAALVGPHRARRGVPVLPAVQQAPPHRDELPEHLVPQARGRAASCPPSTSRPRTPRSACAPSRTSAGRTCSTGSPAPSAAAVRRPARPGTPGSR